MRRVPELDALRGLAAAVVVLFHLDPPRFFFGWTGVDLFFVLSGYLITAIVLENAGSPRFALTFYARRTLRIWPIYYLALGFVVLWNWTLPHPGSLATLPYYLTFTQNTPLYWSGRIPPILAAFDHTWTLALEEQFYLVWPGLVLLAGRRRVVPLCLAVAGLAVLARSGGYFQQSPMNERLLLARCDGFALGGLLAAVLGNPVAARSALRPVRIALGLAFAGAGLYLGWGMIQHGDPIGFLGLPTPRDPAGTILAVEILFAGLVGLIATHAGHLWLRPLRVVPLVYLGQISYGIYLYHYIVFWVIDGGQIQARQPWPIGLEKVLTTLILAALSWHAIERPILRFKNRVRYRPEPAAD